MRVGDVPAFERPMADMAQAAKVVERVALLWMRRRREGMTA